MRFSIRKSGPGKMLWRLGLPICLLTIAGCGASPSAVSPTDASPANLDVHLTLAANPTSPSFVSISAVFVYQGVAVRFSHGETVTCDGVPLTFQPNAYVSEQIPALAPNANYTCVYSKDGVNTDLVFAGIPAPVFISPQEGEAVARQSDFTITYMSYGHSATIQASADNGPHTEGRGGQQPDTGQFTGLDTLALQPGSGTITLIRRATLTLSTAFHSAKVGSSAITRIDVIWT